MNLLFDQNISFRLINKISEDFPKARQVKQLGLENFTDREIWDYAKKNEYTIVTFDADFYDLATYLGHPPKIVWLRTGNRKTDHLAMILISKKDLIEEFLTSEQYQDIACIEID